MARLFTLIMGDTQCLLVKSGKAVKGLKEVQRQR